MSKDKLPDSAFLCALVDNGFGLRIQGSEVIVLANSADTASGLDPQPTVRITMPKYLGIRYYPNQNKRTGPFPPKNPPRVKINNIQQMFDTVNEYRDFLYDSYAEHLEKIQEFRKSKIDDRLDRHRELESRKEEVKDSWTSWKSNKEADE